MSLLGTLATIAILANPVPGTAAGAPAGESLALQPMAVVQEAHVPQGQHQSPCDRAQRRERMRLLHQLELEAATKSPALMLPSDIRSVPGANKQGAEKHLRDLDRNSLKNHAQPSASTNLAPKYQQNMV